MAVDSVYDYWGIVWRRRWVVLTTAAVATATALALSARQDRIYEAFTEFYVAESLPPVGAYSGDVPLIALLQSALLPGLKLEVEYAYQGLLESQAIQSRVYGAVPEKPQHELGAHVRVSATRTHLMRIRVRDGRPETAAQVANAYPRALEGFLADVAAPREQQSLDAAKAAFDRALEGLAKARGELQAFLEGVRAPDMNTTIAESVSRRSSLERELEQARVRLRSVETRIVAAEDRLRRESQLVVSSRQATSSDSARRLIEEIAELQSQMAAASDETRLRALRRTLEQKKESLAAEMETLVTRTQKRFERRPDSLQELLRRQIVEAYVDRAALEAEIAAKTLASQSLAQSADQFPSQRLREENLRAEVDRLQLMVDASATSYEEARAQLTGRSSQIVVVQEARPPSRQAFPLPGTDGVLGALLGLLGGIYLAFASEYLERLWSAQRAA